MPEINLSKFQDDEEATMNGFGQTAQQVQVVHDLISNFVTIFNVTEEEIRTKSQIDRVEWNDPGNAPKVVFTPKTRRWSRMNVLSFRAVPRDFW